MQILANNPPQLHLQANLKPISDMASNTLLNSCQAADNAANTTEPSTQVTQVTLMWSPPPPTPTPPPTADLQSQRDEGHSISPVRADVAVSPTEAKLTWQEGQKDAKSLLAGPIRDNQERMAEQIHAAWDQYDLNEPLFKFRRNAKDNTLKFRYARR